MAQATSPPSQSPGASDPRKRNQTPQTTGGTSSDNRTERLSRTDKPSTLPQTIFEKQAKETAELIERAEKADQTAEKKIDDIVARQTEAEEIPARFRRPIDLPRLPEIPPEVIEERVEPEEEGRVEQLTGAAADAARDRLRQIAADKVKQKVKQEAGRQVGKAAAGAAAKTFGRQALATGIRAFIVANSEILLIIGAVLLLIVAIVAVIFIIVVAVASQQEQAKGTGTNTPTDISRPIDRQILDKVLNGGPALPEPLVRELLTKLPTLRTQFGASGEAQRLLDEIESAAQAILTNLRDQLIVQRQTSIIQNRAKKLLTLVSSFPTCAQAPICLDVPIVDEGKKTHCGRASVLMVLLYITNGTYNDPSQLVRGSSGRFETNKDTASTCVSTPYMNSHAPPNRRGWVRSSWQKLSSNPAIGKEAMLNAIVKSLQGGDPVVFWAENNTLVNSQHIVVIMGYNPSDEGGTFFMNNPLPPKGRIGGRSIPKTNRALTHRREKLTREYMKQAMSGDGDPYDDSVIIRNIYLR